MFDNISFGILSWKSHNTLIRTLKNYKENGLFSYFGQNLVFFNEISDEDVGIVDGGGGGFV
ncbi:MAG: hypothetical protein LBH46_00275, partial [Rickettsiales bacterium]|nr:hypothetical protein [Rickettsiales bacterium]